jgi:hypothetical protein
MSDASSIERDLKQLAQMGSDDEGSDEEMDGSRNVRAASESAAGGSSAALHNYTFPAARATSCTPRHAASYEEAALLQALSLPCAVKSSFGTPATVPEHGLSRPSVVSSVSDIRSSEGEAQSDPTQYCFP